MYIIILTLSAEFLAATRALAAELPQKYIDTNKVQELELKPEVTEAEARHLMASYITSGWYDKVELVHR